MSTTGDNSPTSPSGSSPNRPDTAPTSGEPMGTSEIRGVLDLPTGDQGLRLPKQIGHYLILKRLGRGGMGEVLLGQRSDDQFHKRVAIKLIRKGIDDATDGREVLKRFELERQVLAALNHPNIARLLDAGQMPEPDGRPYFVMEYVEGESIDEYCDRMQLNVDQRLAMFSKVCGAVHHAHQNLVIHRDIKPSNILVDGSGEPKLMDFGIAKLINPAMSGVTFATQFDRGPMTPEYASPEQISGKPVTTSSDVYALGVLLYELLTGRRPYQLKSRAMDAMAQAILNEEPEKPSTAVMHEFIDPTHDGHTRTLTAASLAKPREGEATRLKRKLAGDVDNIVLMAMRKSPQRRYASAEAMSEDIRRHLEGMTVKAVPETWLYVAHKFVRRNRLGVAAAGLVLASIVGGGVAAGVAWKREQAARQRADMLLGINKSVLGRAVDAMGQLASPVAGEDAARLRLETGEEFAKAVGRIQETDATIDLRSERAAAAGLVGKIRTDVRGGATGDAGAGIKLLDESVGLRRAIAGERPSDLEAKRVLITSLIHLGDAYSRAPGRAEEGAKAYEEALSLAKGLAEAGSPDQFRRLLAVAMVARADAIKRLGKGEEAKRLIEQSLRLRRQLAAEKPESALRQRDLSTALGRAADGAVADGDVQGAEALYREAMDIRESLLRQEPSDRSKRDVAIMSAKFATLMRSKTPPDLDAAQRLGDRELAIIEELSSADASNRRLQADLGRALNNSAEVRLMRSDAPGADAATRRSVEVLERVSAQSGSSADLFELARAYELRGSTLKQQGQDARPAWRRSLELYRGLARAEASTLAFTESVSRVEALLGENP